MGKPLADSGVEVVKLERPRVGDLLRDHEPSPGDTPRREYGGLFLDLHGNKRGVTLNLESTTGATILRKLAAAVDVVPEGSPAGYLAARGFGFATLLVSKAGLILTPISPDGQTGRMPVWQPMTSPCVPLRGSPTASVRPGVSC